MTATTPIIVYKIVRGFTKEDKEFISQVNPENRISQCKTLPPGRVLTYRIGEYVESTFSESEGLYCYKDFSHVAALVKYGFNQKYSKYFILECIIIKNSNYKLGEIDTPSKTIPCYLAEKIFVTRVVGDY